ncbi:hypothetical protein ACLKA6_006716 [Drosophila palustris]
MSIKTSTATATASAALMKINDWRMPTLPRFQQKAAATTTTTSVVIAGRLHLSVQSPMWVAAFLCVARK